MDEQRYADLRRLVDSWGRPHAFFQADRPARIRGGLFEDDALDLLSQALLIGRIDGVWFEPVLRLFRVGGVYVTTDFPLHFDDRVFPWVDEGTLLVNQVLERFQGPPPKRVLNLCCGAGTVALALARRWPESQIVGTDKSERAILFAEFNKRLNGLQNVTFQRGDLFGGCLEEYFDLIVTDPPFALQPPGMTEHGHSAGGRHGDAVVAPLLEAAPDYLRPGGRLVMLTYSLGSKKKPRLINKHLAKTLCADGSKPRSKCHLLEGESVWRFRGRKRVDLNPMPVRYMAIRCGDDDYQSFDQRDGVERYTAWIERDLIERGYSHLHYLIVDHTRPER